MIENNISFASFALPSLLFKLGLISPVETLQVENSKRNIIIIIILRMITTEMKTLACGVLYVLYSYLISYLCSCYFKNFGKHVTINIQNTQSLSFHSVKLPLCADCAVI